MNSLEKLEKELADTDRKQTDLTHLRADLRRKIFEAKNADAVAIQLERCLCGTRPSISGSNMFDEYIPACRTCGLTLYKPGGESFRCLLEAKLAWNKVFGKKEKQ